MRSWTLVSSSVAVLMAVASIAGLLSPAAYGQETAAWAAQATGQDVASLLIVVPLLVGAGARAGRGSRRARLLLGGALLYACTPT